MQIAASFSKVDVAGVQCGNCDCTLVEVDFDVDFGLDRQVVGGIDMMQQACKLATRPHIVVSGGEWPLCIVWDRGLKPEPET